MRSGRFLPCRTCVLSLGILFTIGASGDLGHVGAQQAAATEQWSPGQLSPDAIWRVSPDQQPGPGDPAAGRQSIARRSVRLDRDALEALLQGTKPRPGAVPSHTVLYLPTPAGRFEAFAIEESSLLESPLDLQFPEILTFTAQSVEGTGSSGRFSWTPLGFNATILGRDGAIHAISPVGPNAPDEYLVSAGDQATGLAQCLSASPHAIGPLASIPPEPAMSVNSGAALRTYRAAIGATGEFTQRFGGGTVGGALAAIVSGISAANVVLEREASIRLTLVSSEASIIYTDPATDGYTHLDLATMATENHNKLTALIGSGNYDLGHVFDGDAGHAAQGYAFFGICNDAWKDKAGSIYYGVPPADPVGLRTLTHELGHQFFAYHSFNGTTATCGGGRNPEGAYEPGSGSTIMSYSGLCGAENVPATSLYSAGSLAQIIATVQSGAGSVCGTGSTTGNTPPVVNAGADYTIPIGTPFALTATGSDPDGDPVTYSWEQYDLGTASPPTTDDGSRPLFRVYDPTPSPSRMFPELSFVLSNTTAVGQALPATNRTMTFRATARDNRPGGGGVSTDDALITSDATKGPFVVLSPAATTWVAGASETVVWDPAGTTAPPINTGSVRITLSTDNGQTFPFVLAGSTPNDGSETVAVPSVPTSTARVKVEAVGNVFFDISYPAFTIAPAGGSPNLKVTKLATVPSGGYALSGGTVNVKDTTTNAGTGLSPATATKFYVSNDKKWSASDTLLSPPAGRPIPVLAAGAASTQTTPVTLPTLAVGSYYLIARADADSTASESNETDNTKAIPLYIGPDLKVSKLTISPASIAAGGTVSVRVDTKNFGAAPAGASTTRVYYSSNKTLETGTDTLLATIPVGTLGPGAASSDTRMVTIPASAVSGVRFIIAVVDAASQVVEASEKNTKSVKLTVLGELR